VGGSMNQKSDATGAGSGRRVIVTVDTQSCLPPTIDLAVALAAATECALHGLFVEDLDLLSVAKLPFIQEVPLSGGRPRSMDDRQLQRSLNAFSSQFRQALETQAQKFSLSCSYSVVRGHRRQLEFDDVHQGDFLIHGQALLPRARVHGQQRIVLLGQKLAPLLPALEAILQKSSGLRTELLVLAEPGQGQDSIFAELQELLSRFADVVPVVLPADSLPRLAASGSAAIDCIIASRNTQSIPLTEVLQVASCPVIVAANS
jgi:hypothetical protein